jgi:hypothetical protein
MLLACIAIWFSLIGVAFAAEWGVDRPGGDYKNFDLPADQPSLCEQACNAEGQCKAWTFVRPGVQGASARCWLKNVVPPKQANTCCVSGKKASSGSAVEPNRDRPGMDYKNFDLPAAVPLLCKAACDVEGQCKAWTYVKPGVQGANPRCWLKNGVPPKVTSNCCTSGVK